MHFPKTENFVPKILSYSVERECTTLPTPNNGESSGSVISGARWITTPHYYLVLQFEKICVVNMINIGKFNKAQSALLKEFKIFGGLTPACKHELLHSGLRGTDERSELFELSYTIKGTVNNNNNGIEIPIKYLKIVPQVTKASPTSLSFWLVELWGTDDTNYMQQVLKNYEDYKEREVARMCLKHFRQKGMVNPFTSLLIQTFPNFSLDPVTPSLFQKLYDRTQFWEHPILTHLHNQLVVLGEFVSAQNLLNFAFQNMPNIFDEYLWNIPYIPKWTRILPKEGEPHPGMRGGHQMCLDESRNQIFLFGGWDGSTELDDLWMYDIKTEKWSLLSCDTQLDGGPGPRSCHKICYDESTRKIYTIGRYVDVDSTSTHPHNRPSTTNSNPNHPITSITTLSPSGILPSFVSQFPLFQHTHSYPHTPPSSSSSSSSTQQPSSPSILSYTQVAPLNESNPTNNPSSISLMTQPTVLPLTPLVFSNPSISQVNSVLEFPTVADIINNTTTSPHPTNTNTNPTPSATNSRSNALPDFYCYSVETQKWELLSRDTSKEGGPGLIFDHQMVLDPIQQTIYIFGGKTLSSSTSTSSLNSFTSSLQSSPSSDNYSGLFKYDIKSKKWTLLRDDSSSFSSSSLTSVYPKNTPRLMELRSRIGHSMLFDSSRDMLYIFAGQRNKDYLSDFCAYDLIKDKVHEIERDSHKKGGPEGGFTQRATIDTQKGEIYILSGLMREKQSNTDTVKNSFWVYKIENETWSRIYQNENTAFDYWEKMKMVEPRPRFAHQLVYNSEKKVHYLFGGNPGDNSLPARLDDFWRLDLEQISRETALSRAIFQIRKQNFIEMCRTVDRQTSLKYLREEVSSIVHPSDTQSLAQIKTLPILLFNPPSKNEVVNQYEERTRVFESLLEFFPSKMRQPSTNLAEFVHM